MEFMEESRRRIAALTKPRLGRTVELRELHTLKGNTGMFGLVHTARFLHDLEDLLLRVERELNDGGRFRRLVGLCAGALAPSEGEVDIYPGSGFLEVAVFGPYTSLAASASLSWTVQWPLVKIASSVNAR